MTQVLDYSKDCGACSAPLASPPRDGVGSMCAYLHTRQGREDFAKIMEGVTPRPTGATFTPDGTTNVAKSVTKEPEMEYGVTLGVTSEGDSVTQDSDDVTDETKQQRYYRLNKERLNQQRKDGRNHT